MNISPRSILTIHEESISYQPTDRIDNLMYFTEKIHDLVEVGLNVELAPELLHLDSMMFPYKETYLFMKEEVAKEFLSFLAIDYQTVGMFMKLSEGRHPIDCLKNLFMKYCKEYQTKTMSVSDYVQTYKKMIAKGSIVQEENILLPQFMSEIEISYQTRDSDSHAHFYCEEMWIEEDGIGATNYEISLFLNEESMKKADITFFNPCLIEKW